MWGPHPMRCPQGTYKGEISRAVVMLQNTTTLLVYISKGFRRGAMAQTMFYCFLAVDRHPILRSHAGHQCMRSADLIRLVETNYFFLNDFSNAKNFVLQRRWSILFSEEFLMITFQRNKDRLLVLFLCCFFFSQELHWEKQTKPLVCLLFMDIMFMPY